LLDNLSCCRIDALLSTKRKPVSRRILCTSLKPTVSFSCSHAPRFTDFWYRHSAFNRSLHSLTSSRISIVFVRSSAIYSCMILSLSLRSGSYFLHSIRKFSSALSLNNTLLASFSFYFSRIAWMQFNYISISSKMTKTDENSLSSSVQLFMKFYSWNKSLLHKATVLSSLENSRLDCSVPRCCESMF